MAKAKTAPKKPRFSSTPVEARSPGDPSPEVYEKKQGRVKKVDNRELTFGEGFLRVMSKEQRQKALEECVARHGFKDCLAKVRDLEQNSMIRQRYGSFLVEKHGPQTNPLRVTLDEHASVKKLKNRLMR